MTAEERPPEHAPARLPAVPESTVNGFPLSSRPQRLDWTFTTLDRTRPEHRRLAMRCADMDCTKLETVIGKTLDVEHVYLSPRELIDAETGEVIIKTSVALITPDGEPYHCLSTGAYNSLRAAWQEVGPGPWTDPLVFEVRQIPLADGKRTFKLRFLGRRSELGGSPKKGHK